MANDVRNDNFIFPSRHVPDCFINSQVMNKLDTISNTIGNIDHTKKMVIVLKNIKVILMLFMDIKKELNL